MTANLPLPKILYPSGASPGTTFTFVYPPREVPYKDYSVVRHDNIASSGVRESIFERMDEFLTFTMEYAKLGSDIQAWDAFIIWALQGAAFDYYPDSTVAGTHTAYVLEDTTWTPAYKQLGMYTFNVRFRKSITWP
jgi:hypothetical protein